MHTCQFTRLHYYCSACAASGVLDVYTALPHCKQCRGPTCLQCALQRRHGHVLLQCMILQDSCLKAAVYLRSRTVGPWADGMRVLRAM